MSESEPLLSGPIAELNLERVRVQTLYTELSGAEEAAKLWQKRAEKAEREVLELKEKIEGYEF